MKTLTFKYICCLIMIVGILSMPVGAQARLKRQADRVYYPYQSYYYPRQYSYSYVLSEPIEVLPEGYRTLIVDGKIYFYHQGVFFQKTTPDQLYVIVPPPVGATVTEVPTGYQLVKIGDQTIYQYGGVYYRRVLSGYQIINPPLSSVAETITVSPNISEGVPYQIN